MTRSVWLLLIALLFPAGAGGETPDTTAEDTPDGGVRFGAAPELRTRNLDGKLFVLGSALEQGPAVVTFWATWCKPCRKEMPELQRLVEHYGERGFQVIAVNGDGPVDQAKVRPYVRALGYDFTVIPDPEGQIRKRFQVEVFPTTFLYDREGMLAWSRIGFRKGDEALLEAELTKLLPRSR